MKAKGWIVAAVLAGGIVFVSRGCGDTTAPDQQLARRFGELCDIARKHVKTPEPGVRALGHYLGKHGGHLLGELGSTITLIERIPDERAHDERARIARDRLQRPLRACHDDWQRFGEAVEADPAASRLLEHGVRRLNRTLEILFGSQLTLQPSALGDDLERLVTFRQLR